MKITTVKTIIHFKKNGISVCGTTRSGMSSHCAKDVTCKRCLSKINKDKEKSKMNKRKDNKKQSQIDKANLISEYCSRCYIFFKRSSNDYFYLEAYNEEGEELKIKGVKCPYCGHKGRALEYFEEK